MTVQNISPMHRRHRACLAFARFSENSLMLLTCDVNAGFTLATEVVRLTDEKVCLV